MAPSGVLLVGAALALRDALQEVGGRRLALACIAGGAVLSLSFSPSLAVASAVAFSLSELADFAVYSRLRERSMSWAVMASGLVGAILDSIAFSWLAFGSLTWAPGLLIAKLYASALYAALICARGKFAQA